ncbi:MAG TPA: DUF4124 domain-containing protein [Gammaproteobacteria bacterium]
MKALAPSLLSLAAILPALALADNAQVFKWTDVSGVVHYSDKPPAEAAEAELLDLPALPPQDPVKLAQDQAALLASVAALQKNAEVQAMQEQAAKLAEQQAQLQAALAALAEAQSRPVPEPVPAVYAVSAFMPRAFHPRWHEHPGHDKPDPRRLPDRPAKSLLKQP